MQLLTGTAHVFRLVTDASCTTLGQADAVIATGLQGVLEGEVSHVYNVQLDNQIIKSPDFLEVQSL